MAGKSWNPSHEPSHEREREQAPIALIKQWKERRERGGEQPMIGVPMLVKCSLTSKMLQMHLGPRACGILAYAHIQTSLTTKEQLVLLAVNSAVKLHVSAFFNGFNDFVFPLGSPGKSLSKCRLNK